ncbi:hypothetical protein [Halostella sp. PRR32]|uniref:hypothetical protein n=1 Tax=Halostella sp. PRR32 TaxID=3098147 RepID=UPI00110EA5C8|nr:hypothetical protein [Halostella sp. PRR32]
MVDRRQRLGAVLLLCGAALLVTGSVGFADVMADRPGNITVANDPDAYLGVTDNSADSAASISGGNDTGNAYFLDDNAAAFGGASAFDTAVDRIDYDDGTTDTDPGVYATVRDTDAVGLTTSHDYVLQLECKDGATDQGTGYVTVSVTATGDETVDLQRTTNQKLSIDCT